jgi:BlaI family penicillinase repressor
MVESNPHDKLEKPEREGREARQLGALQLAILAVLWERGEATASEVHLALFEAHGLAPTTIATMLKKMEARELVDHRVDGRVFVYRAAVAQDEARRAMVEEFVGRAFRGDPLALVNHLLAEGEIDVTELDALRRRIAQRRRGEGRS